MEHEIISNLKLFVNGIGEDYVNSLVSKDENNQPYFNMKKLISDIEQTIKRRDYIAPRKVKVKVGDKEIMAPSIKLDELPSDYWDESGIITS